MTAKPLEGLRILELGAYISAPYAGSILCSLGAEVVKVEPPGAGEAFRRGAEEKSAYFVQYNAGKKSVTADLKDPAGIALINALLPHFDVVLENFRPGKMAAIGLGPEDCHKLNPHLVYASISGFGNIGPLRDRPAYDTVGQSVGGLYTVMNDDGQPQLTGTCVADLITAVNAAMGIMAALLGRERDPERKGVTMETSIFEAVSTLTIDAMTQMFDETLEPVRDSRHPQAQNFCLRTASGGSISIHLSSSQKFWTNFARAINRPELIEDARFRTYKDRVRHHVELKHIASEEVAQWSQVQIEARLLAADVPHAPVLTLSDVARHEQTDRLQLLGRAFENVTLVRPPWRFNGERPTRNEAAPRVGEHSQQIAREMLNADELARIFGSASQ
jgi:crotonobetainyl-CoA:carnitine CoA-transferase CaiB-like acyl-CoA transferase